MVGTPHVCPGMKGLLNNTPKVIRTVCLAARQPKLKRMPLVLYSSCFQGDSICNGTHNKKASDPQLFEAQFEELVTELTERDLDDPVLADALSRLREVCMLCCISLISLNKFCTNTPCVG